MKNALQGLSLQGINCVSGYSKRTDACCESDEEAAAPLPNFIRQATAGRPKSQSDFCRAACRPPSLTCVKEQADKKAG